VRSKLKALGVIGKNNRNINEKEENIMNKKAAGSGISRLMKGVCFCFLVMALALPAFGEDKLIVKDAGGTNTVFSVDDNGTFQVPNAFIWDNVNKRVGYGLTNPTAAFHLNYKTALAPFILERELDASGAVSMVGDNYGGAGAGSGTGAGMLFRYNKGTKAAPAAVAVGDRLGFLVFGGYSGSAVVHTAAINSLVDAGTVSSTSLPTYLQFMTTPNGSTARQERLRIAGDGRLRLSNQPAAPANNDTCTVGDLILDAANGYLYLCTATNTWQRAQFAAY
jgi:hypothetical protein